MREYTEYKWKKDRLYYGNEFCYEILPHEEYPEMWWLVKPNGEKIDFFNIQRVKDNARKLDQSIFNRSAEERRHLGRCAFK